MREKNLGENSLKFEEWGESGGNYNVKFNYFSLVFQNIKIKEKQTKV